jgi:tetratricopeptide (TPR) repeat protein
MALGNLEEAKLLFERAIQVAERPTEIFYRYLAKCYNRMGQYKKAVEVLQQQIDQGVNLLSGYYNLARVHKLNMNAEEALKALKAGKALKNSGSRDFDKQMVYIYVELLEDFDAAEKKLRSMKRTRPDDSETKEALAFYYHETAQYHKEYKILSQAQKYDAIDWHDFAKCIQGLGGHRFSTTVRNAKYKKQLAEALAKTRELAKEELEDYEVRALALKSLAAAAIDAHDLEAADKYLTEMSCTQLCDHCFHGQCCEYYHQVARYELACGNREEALRAARKACEIAPDDREFRELAKELEQ